MTNKILCIPRIESIIKIDYIQKTIEKVSIGHIKKIVEIPHRNDPHYKRILIYIKLNESSPNTKIIQERFSLKQDVKIIHQFPWYLKIVEASFTHQKK